MIETAAPHLCLGDGVAWLEAQPPDSLDGIFSDPPWGSGPNIVGQVEWQSLLLRVLRAAERVVRSHGHVLLWYGQAQLDPIFRRILPQTGLFLNALLTIQFIPPRVYASYNTLDAIFVLGRTRHARPRGTPYAVPVHYVSATKPDRAHPCSRPVTTVGKILRDWFAQGDVICDPFAGSDTTGWQAHHLGMICYSFEIDPALYAVAQSRWAQQNLFEEIAGAPDSTESAAKARAASEPRRLRATPTRAAGKTPS